MQKSIKTPVLFLVFNRPEKTKLSFDAIRNARPKKLYVAADAPRDNRPDDEMLCKKVREIVLNIDWECETHYLFHENNLGCSLSGKTAWDWFFSQEEEMIFIEDDAVPSVSFFSFCQELLEKYRNDKRIAYIGGVNYGLKYGNASYFFSFEPSATYSMATWKRVYDLYEYNMESFYSIKNTVEFKSTFISKFAYKYWIQKMESYVDSIYHGKRLNTYDIQMIYLVHKYKMLSIYPNINMVSNSGLDYNGANNNINPNSSFAKKYSNRPKFELNTLIHPKEVLVDKRFEKKMFIQRSLYDNPLRAKCFYYFYPTIRPIIRSVFNLLHIRFNKKNTK
jgi:hypothetical protein